MIETLETIDTGLTKVIGVKLRGTLHDEDYQQFVPQIETILTAAGKVRLFIQFEDFHGWDVHAAWDDVKFAMRHYADFERIAMVGDRKWEQWMAALCKPFTKAKVRYFDELDIEAAWQWLREDDTSEAELAGKEHALNSADEPEAWHGFPSYGF